MYPTIFNSKSPAQMRSSLHSENGKPSVFGDFVFMETKTEHWRNLDLHDLPNEIWKDVPKYEGKYAASNLGRIKSLERYVNNKYGKFNRNKALILRQKRTKGYLSVTLIHNGERYQTGVHRHVGTAFIPNPLNLPQINHKDFDGRNNVVENLEWGTARYNINYTKDHGRAGYVGEKNVHSILKECDVIYIRQNYIKYKHGEKERLSKKFGVAEETIEKVVFRCTWKHLK